MSLTELFFEPDFAPLPDAHRALADDAISRSVALSAINNPDRVPEFVMSNPAFAWKIADGAATKLSPSSRSFCEWGAGLGLVTFFAERAGFEATGIELNSTLVGQSHELAAAHQLSSVIRQGSYKPDGFYEGTANPSGFGLFDAGITFAYAWPAEVAAITQFFDNNAPPSAIFLLYQGGTNISALQKA